MKAPPPAIVWFRDDLRLADNPALRHAVASGRPLNCIFVFDEASAAQRRLGGAARWWLHGSLVALAASLERMGGSLWLFRGAARQVVPRLAEITGAAAVHWNRRYGAAEREIDEAIKLELTARGIEAKSFNSHLLYEPWSVTTREGRPFRVFSPFWRAATALGPPPAPEPAPGRIVFAHPDEVFLDQVIDLPALRLAPTKPDWAGGLRRCWEPGERGAKTHLDRFLETSFATYAQARDRPDAPTTSALAPYLRFGNISARHVWHAAAATQAAAGEPCGQVNLHKFVAELGWREFSYHLLFHNRQLARVNLQQRFDRMRWRSDADALEAWQRGRTGYPLVDAGMRQLWETGWMHNRVRMVAASFLVKHLLIDWREGEAWFWDTLVDADPASNPASWQWVAGCGADAAPFFRIFNPVLQGEKFDPEGTYVKRWLPELRALPRSALHRPWEAKRGPGGALGDYPGPIVDHQRARQRALDAFEALGHDGR